MVRNAGIKVNPCLVEGVGVNKMGAQTRGSCERAFPQTFFSSVQVAGTKHRELADAAVFGVSGREIGGRPIQRAENRT